MIKFIDGIVANSVLWVSILAWFLAQIIKIIIALIRNKKVDLRLLVSSGGMPSSHSSFVCAMSTSIGISEGFESSIFAVSAIISMVVMYDASGVRRAAGKQAEVLNLIIDKVENVGVNVDKKLKELLGHSPIEVACGALLGIITALFINN